MLTLRITTGAGELIVVEGAMTITYVKICPYTDHEFQTEQPRRIFCCDSHKVMFSKKNRPDLPSPLASKTRIPPKVPA